MRIGLISHGCGRRSGADWLSPVWRRRARRCTETARGQADPKAAPGRNLPTDFPRRTRRPRSHEVRTEAKSSRRCAWRRNHSRRAVMGELVGGQLEPCENLIIIGTLIRTERHGEIVDALGVSVRGTAAHFRLRVIKRFRYDIIVGIDNRHEEW